ncbi:MAG: HD domain-containing protein [Pseudomonadota bacterium]
MSLEEDRLQRARDWAARHHADQRDKLDIPYLAHVADVARRVEEHGPVVEAIAWLHDVVEDAGVSLDAIEESFGPRIRAGVDALSRRPGEAYFAEYLPRLSACADARPVKRADAAHNWGKTALLAVRDPEKARSLAKRYARVLSNLGDPEPVCAPIEFQGGAWRPMG